MTIRVYPNLSPRIIYVLAPDTAITIQELHNELQDWMDEPAAMSYPNLAFTTGKQELGGGVQVGLTLELQNAQLAFEERTTPLSSGSATAAGTLTLTDTSATFITDGVTRGDIVHSHDGMSSATVVTVDSETQITHTALKGITTSWSVADSYDIFTIVQCSVTGGNLVAVDLNGDELDPIFSTAYTQVVRTSSSSATLSNQTSLESGVFGGIVYVNDLTGTAGTAFPNGTLSSPVSNLTDAKSIAATYGLSEIKFLRDYTFGATDVLDGYTISGLTSNATLFTLTPGVSTENTLFRTASITGTVDGYTRAQDCELKGNIYGLQGLFENCINRVGTFHLISDPTKLFVMNNCKSGVVTGEPQPVVDINGDGAGFIVRAYSGPLIVGGKTGDTSGICLDFISGKLTLDSSNTAGLWPVRGTVYVVDNLTGTAVSDLNGVGSAHQNADFVWDEPLSEHSTANTMGLTQQQLVKLLRNKQITDPVTGIMTVYDDDGSTVLFQANIYETTDTDQLYRGSGIERRERLQ